MSDDSARNSRLLAATWLERHSPQLAAIVKRMSVTDGVIHMRPSKVDPTLILY
jgi:hypothetical protein